MSKINLKHNILMSSSFRIVVMFVFFLTSVFSTRYLGVELRGKYGYLYTLSGLIWMVFDMGLYRSFPYLVRKYPDKIGTLYLLTITQFICNITILPILGISYLSFWSKVIGFSFNPYIIFILAFLIAFPKLNSQMQGLYLGLDKVWKNSIAQLLTAIVLLIIVATGFIFFRETNRLAYVLSALVLATVVGSIYYLSGISWESVWKKPDFNFIIKSYKYGFRVFLSSLFIMLLIRFDVILIKKMIGFQDVGIYSIAAHVIDLLQIASNMVGALLLVKLSDCKDDIEKWIIMKKLIMSFFIMLTFANIGFVIFGNLFISALYGVQFLPVYSVYLWLIPASYGLSFGSLFNMYLNSKGFPIISIILPAIALLVNITLNIILIPFSGINGAAFATSFSYLFWFILIVVFEHHASNRKMLLHLIPSMNDWILLKVETLKYLNEIVRKRKKL